jgi:hypothetical protein
MVKRETAEDIQREAKVAAVVRAKWNCRLEKTPEFYRVDFLAFRDGAPKAWVEIKARHKISLRTYEHIWLSLQRVSALMHFAADTNLPAFAVFGLSDGIYAHRLKMPTAYRIEMGGRTDRNDPNDLEPCCCLPQDDFSVIEHTW